MYQTDTFLLRLMPPIMSIIPVELQTNRLKIRGAHIMPNNANLCKTMYATDTVLFSYHDKDLDEISA